MRKLLSLAVVLLLGVSTLFAQTHLVKGRILDGDGKPVDGATVRVKKGTAVTAADAQGNFKIEAKSGDVLVISAVNFGTKEVKLGNETDVAVTLARQSSQLDEVVVTAMGIKRSRNALPYAAQEVGGDEVSKTRNSNFVDGLSGKVAGLQITQPTALGASTNVVLRGIKSISQSNQALFVVDGVPFDNTSSASGGQRAGQGGYDYGSNAADLNPDDIESISVLKGAAASALYGSRAANGVILITTKKAKRGLGITVNAGANVGSYDKSTFVKYQHQYGANYGSGPEIGGAFPYGYGSPDGNFLYAPLPQFGQNTPQLIVPTTEDASYGAKFDPNLLVYQWDAFANYPGNPNYGKPTPWVAAKNDPSTFFVNPVSYNTSVFIDGGGENGTFKLGYLRTSDNGILPNSNITKNMFNFGATHNLSKDLTVGGTINYSEISGLGRYGTGYESNNIMSNFRQWWEMNVDIKQQKAAYFNSGGKNVTWNMTDPVNGNTNPIYWDNVYFVRYQNYEQDSRQRIFGNAYINYTPSKSITLLGRVSMDTYNSLQEERDAIGSVNVPFYSRNNIFYKEMNYDFLATYNKDLSKNFNFKALLGANLRQDTYSSIFASTNGGLNLPNFYALSNSVNPINAPVEALLEKEVGGVFAGATLTYKDMLTLDGTIRRDQSSTLPAGNNAYTYPAISGSWAFYKMIDNAPWISFGKVRLNYAEVGNDAPYHSVLNTYTINSPFNGNALVSLPTVNNNPNLKPERTKSFETGLEMSFLKNRLGFDFTYFTSKTFDLITQVNTSGATGYRNQYVNFGSIQNNGIELSLNGTPIRTRNFSWDINVNWSKINNKVLSLFNNQQNQVLQSYQGGVSVNATVGQPFGTIQGNDFVYTNGQRTVGSDGYYMMDTKTTDIIGNATPKWTGGINNSFRYKSFTLSFLIDMRHGGNVFSLDTYYGLADGIYAETAGLNDLGNPSRNSLANGGGIILKGVTADGKPNTIRVDNSGTGYGLYGYVYNPARAFVYDASFVKLRELNISYSIPQKTIERMKPIKGIDIAIVGRNLWIISKNVPYADPEDGLGAGNAQGYQSGSYPAVRNIGFNVKFKF
ncbi:MAG: SusC/RagA family TonB-linked outer membrane protein [Bacteroidota bacterium]|nr:SusC/RagA family TonB-linked outer membrane protein [Bacteroidota bacterium]